MDNLADKLERIKSLLWELPLAHCIVYRIVQADSVLELKPFKAISPYANSQVEFDRLATACYKLAVSSFQRRENLVLKENVARSDSQGEVLELVPPAQEIKNPPPVNSQGQRWWHIALGAGATREAGCVIVARIAATDESAVFESVTAIENIMSKSG